MSATRCSSRIPGACRPRAGCAVNDRAANQRESALSNEDAALQEAVDYILGN